MASSSFSRLEYHHVSIRFWEYILEAASSFVLSTKQGTSSPSTLVRRVSCRSSQAGSERKSVPRTVAEWVGPWRPPVWEIIAGEGGREVSLASFIVGCTFAHLLCCSSWHGHHRLPQPAWMLALRQEGVALLPRCEGHRDRQCMCPCREEIAECIRSEE